MSLFNALMLGIIQGVAEFLPISSSGHLSIAQNLLGLGVEGTDDVFFDVLLHLGTLAAVFVAYWSDIKDMVLEFFRTIGDIRRGSMPKDIPPARRLILLIICRHTSAVPGAPHSGRGGGPVQQHLLCGGGFAGYRCLLFACDRIRKGRKNEKSTTIGDVLIIGVGQAIATCPGISRSGMTISTGCFCGLERRFAVRFAFLLSIPAVLAPTSFILPMW